VGFADHIPRRLRKITEEEREVHHVQIARDDSSQQETAKDILHNNWKETAARIRRTMSRKALNDSKQRIPGSHLELCDWARELMARNAQVNELYNLRRLAVV
jgi:hypothetical protein